MHRTLRRALAGVLLALPVTASAQQQQGTPRDSDYLARAKALVAQKRYLAALATFDSLLRADPGSRDATLGRAQMLAWIGRFNDALRAYERWVATHPKDVEAIEQVARILTWLHRFDEAEKIYKVLALGGSLEAERGLARIATWRGDLGEGERRWRRIVERHPNDADAWVGLAQVLRWTNRPRAARAALARALDADPGNRDATEQLRWVEAALRPRIDPGIVSMNDTDDNEVTTTTGTFAVGAPWEGELSVRAQHRAAGLGGTQASSVGASVGASAATARFVFRGSLGATRLDDSPAALTARDVLTGAAAISARLGRRTRLGADVSRTPFDETAPLIARGIVTTAFGAGGSFELTRRVTLSGEFERAELTGGTPNTRTGGSASLRWRSPFVLSLATSARAFGYAVDAGEGYFSPSRYVLAEASARLDMGGDLGWSVMLDGGLGTQSIDAWSAGATTRPASRGAVAITYRPSPRTEWSASTSTANAVSPATATLGSYRASVWTVRGKVGF